MAAVAPAGRRSWDGVPAAGACLLLAGAGLSFWDFARRPGGLASSLLAGEGAGVALTALAAVWTAWCLVWCRREGRGAVGWALVVAGVGAAAPMWAITWLPTAAVPAAFALALVMVPALSTTAPAWPGRPEGAIVHALWAAGAFAFAVQLAGLDPFREPGCSPRCPDVSPAADRFLTHHEAVSWSAAATGVAVVLGSLLVVRARRTTPRALLGGVLLALAVQVVTLGHGLASGTSSATPWVRDALTAAHLLVLCGVTAAAMRLDRTRRALRRLVARLDAGIASGSDAESLTFARPEGGWVDSRGMPVEVGPTGVLTSPDGQHLARVDPGLLGGTPLSEPEIRAADAMDWLVLEGARLTALVRARHREVAAAQRRMVSRSDDERRRIARDLHDGAQQRLVSAKLYLTLARTELPAEALPGLGEAEKQIQQALTGLRGLTHEVFPRLVESDGLGPALTDLVARTDRPVLLEVEDLPHPLPLTVALAAYEVAVTCLHQGASVTSDRHVGIRVWRTSEGWLGVRVTAETGGLPHESWPEDVQDKVASLGGVVRDTQGRTEVLIPCG